MHYYKTIVMTRCIHALMYFYTMEHIYAVIILSLPPPYEYAQCHRKYRPSRALHHVDLLLLVKKAY